MSGKRSQTGGIGWVLAAGAAGVAVILLGNVSYTLDGVEASFFGHFSGLAPNEMGDALAGVFGSLAFLAAAGAIILQSHELAAQREELRLTREEVKGQKEASQDMAASLQAQRFEQTFFEMLSTAGRIADEISFRGKGSGGPSTRELSRTLFQSLRNKQYRSHFPENYQDAYDHFWGNYGSKNLGHYFRFLFNFFKFLSTSEHSLPFHGKLLRSQLSDDEMTLLFYNCLSSQGRKFEQLAIEFELFDNMPESCLLDVADAKIIDPRVFGPDKRGLLRE